MVDRKYLDIIRAWAPIVLEPIAKPAGLTKAVDAFAAAAGRQADALALFQKRPDSSVRPGAEAFLLRPDRSPVPFAGRDREVAEFEDWMFSDGWMKWRLLTGPSGRGKTRLMMGVVDRLNALGDRPARAGFLDLDTLERNPGALGGFAGVKGDLLLVVDYAERARQPVVAVLNLALMLERLAEAGAERRVRVVLIARGWSEVWDDIGRQHSEIQEVLMAEGLELVDLPPLAETVPDRLAEFDRAFEAFDRYFRNTEHGEPPRAEQRPVLQARSGRDDYADAVMIHLAALGIRRGALNPRDINDDRLLQWIIDRERGEWARRVAAAGLGAEISPKAMEQAAGLATLVALADRAPGESRMMELLGACPLLADQPAARRSRIVDILHDLYPGAGHTAGLAPDLIGTYFLGQFDPAFFARVFPSLSETEALNALTKLNWLCQSRPAEGANRVGAALSAAPTRVLPLVVDVARLSGDPIGRVAAEWFETHGSTELALAVTRRGAMPRPTTALREFAVQVESTLFRSVQPGGSQDSLAARARHANNLSLRLSDLDRREEALAAIEEAVAIRRALADARPDAFTSDLATSLGTHGMVLRALDRHSEAADRFGEGLPLLAPHLRRSPQAFARLCASLLREHLQSLLAAGREPDEELLSPIVEILVEQGAIDLDDFGGGTGGETGDPSGHPFPTPP